MPAAERKFEDFAETTAPIAPASVAAIDNILRLAFNGVASARAPSPAAEPQPDFDFGIAASLLDRAISTISTLTKQRDDLERAIVHQEEVFARQEELLADKVAQTEAKAAEWERRAKVIKEELQDGEGRLAALQMRNETLTYRAESAEARLALAEQTAAESRKQAQMYHDRIVATFSKLS